jgi:hypothetical protein
MAFGSFKTLQEVLKLYQVKLVIDRFIQPVTVPVNEAFASDLTFTLQNISVGVSEASIGEFMVAPVLKETWKPYCDTLLMWSHAPFGSEEPLMETPDYFFSRRSPLGLVPDQAYLIVVEAKKDDFDAGWAQCLAAMLAAQKMNDQPAMTIFGCVSTGQLWKFAKLEGQVLTQELQGFVISNLPELCGALHYLFRQAKEQLLALAA